MGRTELDLACEAIRAACADAGLPVGAIDGFVSYHIEQVAEVDLVTDARHSPSCGSWRARRRAAAARRRCSGWPRVAVASGTAECVVAFRARNRSKAASYGADPNQGGRPWAKARRAAARLRASGSTRSASRRPRTRWR